MSMQSQFKSKALSVLLERIELLTVIKNEPEIVEISIDDILGSSDEDEEIIPDIKDDIEIVSHIISEDLIKGENILESKHLESVETKIVVQTENIPFIKTKNIDITEDTSDDDGNVSGGTDQNVEEVQGSNEELFLNFAKDLNGNNTRSRKAKHPEKKCYETVETTSCKKIKEKRKVIEVPLLPVEPHEHITLTKDIQAHNKNKGTRKKRKAKMYNRRLKYPCDRCKYKSSFSRNLKRHKLIHLKPEEIPYFCCYHCSHKSKQKGDLKTHIFGHFRREEIPFHCYICDFVTLKRDLIIEHFKKHPKHHSKYDETEYKNLLETYTKKQMRYYSCKKCALRTYDCEKLKLHELTHKTENDDRHFKYRCDKCNYKTFRHQDFKRHKLIHLNPEEIHYFYCYHCSYTCKQKANLQTHIFRHFNRGEIPFDCYICDFTTLKRNLIIEHFKKYHSKFDEAEYKNQLETYTKKHTKRYWCAKCTFVTGKSANFKRYKLTHKIKKQTNKCDKCNYKTNVRHSFQMHQLIHLKPKEIQYFYCYHCTYKSKRKNNLANHIIRHFNNGLVKFHCYICDFVTLKRKSITEHIKEHSKVRNKSKIK